MMVIKYRQKHKTGVRGLPINFFFNICSVAAPIIRQKQASVTQPVHIHFYIRFVHNHYIRIWTLTCNLNLSQNNLMRNSYVSSLNIV